MLRVFDLVCQRRRLDPSDLGQLRTIESLNKEIAEVARELSATANAGPIARRLMTVPGVAPSTLVRFVAALDEIKHRRQGRRARLRPFGRPSTRWARRIPSGVPGGCTGNWAS
jgi:transposase